MYFIGTKQDQTMQITEPDFQVSSFSLLRSPFEDLLLLRKLTL